jgi:hypothetical protein
MNRVFLASCTLAPKSLARIESQLIRFAQFDVQTVSITSIAWERT